MTALSPPCAGPADSQGLTETAPDHGVVIVATETTFLAALGPRLIQPGGSLIAAMSDSDLVVKFYLLVKGKGRSLAFWQRVYTKK